MSWSISYDYKDDDVTEEGQESFDALIDKFDKGEISQEAINQLNVLFNAADDVLMSGVVGDPTKEYRVVLSGHANPGHKPAPGWSNDCITINIYQK